ncbi:MAG TPA: GNAT family protein [Dehalococcoidia bacterium]|nr:GNAT family protein [Dehalococcoidia bacterium]
MTAGRPAFDLRPVVLQGRHVRLEPIALGHADALFAAGRDGAIWRWMPLHPQSVADMRDIVATRLAAQQRGEGLTWATVHLPSGDVVGSTSFLNVSAPDRRLEIGFTWIAPRVQRTPLNTEAKYLQLRHAFETIGCLRVELKTDARNLISQRAIERIGGVREGVFRKHMYTHTGFQRDSVYYSIIDDEWPATKARLEALLLEQHPASTT